MADVAFFITAIGDEPAVVHAKMDVGRAALIPAGENRVDFGDALVIRYLDTAQEGLLIVGNFPP
jgi:hypothetical protein